MSKKGLIIVLVALTLLTLNICAAQEIDNSTDADATLSDSDEPALEIDNESQVLEATKASTHIEVAGQTDFDVIGDYFKVKLLDSSNKAIKNTKISFTVNGKSYSQNTDSSGIAKLQVRLNDGTYNVLSKFAGNSNYHASSISTKITVDNTREVESGMTSAQIQSIIDGAKANNVILFKGSSYSNINLIITKCLTLQSTVATTLKSSSSSPVITIQGSKASLTRVKGFNIESAGDAIRVNGADYVTIYGNDITSKGNGIVGLNTKYLNITKNNIVKNSKSGISIAQSSYSYVFNNKITDNAKNGIEVAKSSHVYIHGNIISGNGNGIYLGNNINGKNYGEGPSDVYINKNTISKNGGDGIYVNKAGDNVNVISNSIESNSQNGISLSEIGNNKIQSNVISDNGYVGIEFGGNYVMPKKQDISYNAIVGNREREVEARDTYYSLNDGPLKIGDNWYSDGIVCPKIKTNKIRFAVTQTGPNQFQAAFIDSKGNLASLLPDRTLSYRINDGKSVKLTISGGVATFTVDADDGDVVKAIVDNSRKDNVYDSNSRSSSQSSSGKTPGYDYPSIPDYQLYEDIGTGGSGSGDGYGTGQGSGGNANRGNGHSDVQSSENTGNSTHSQKTDPASNADNQVNDVDQSYETQATTSPASASESGSGVDAGSGSTQQSVIKQILIEEDEFYKITGISFIILLIILTIGLYYREEIHEMKDKM